MSVHIFLPGDKITSEQVRSSKLASSRLRMWPLVETALEDGRNVTLGDTAPSHTEFAVIGKIGASNIAWRQDHWLRQMKDLQNANRHVVLDYTDHHLETSSAMTPFYSKAMHNCDTIVCPTDALSVELKKFVTSKKLWTIFDLLEYPTEAPKNRFCGKNLKAMWFGHASNARFLARFIDANHAAMADHQLTVVSTSETLQILQRYPYQQRPALRLKFADWSVKNVLGISRDVDYCVIPSDRRSPKRFASNNRLVTALSLGLPTIATAINSYAEFSEYFAEEGSETASEVFKNPSVLRNRILEFQASRIAEFQKQGIMHSWRQLLRA